MNVELWIKTRAYYHGGHRGHREELLFYVKNKENRTQMTLIKLIHTDIYSMFRAKSIEHR